MKEFGFLAPGKVIFGAGTTKRISEVLTEGDGVILLLTDKGIEGTGLAADVAGLIEASGHRVFTFADVPAEPYLEDVDRVYTALTGSKVVQIVALGGGSVMDTAKLLSIQFSTGESVNSLRENPPSRRGVPMVMIPTTAGTGSESTPNSIIALKKEQTKTAVISPWFLPDAVILDPENTRSLPAKLTAAGGLDTLCHLMECYVSAKRNPHSDMMAERGMELAFSSLTRAFHHGDDMEARGNMLLASYYGGACIASSGTMAIHGMSYPLGGKFRVPHGVSNAILLEPVFRYISSSIEDLLPRIADCAGLGINGGGKVMDLLKSMVQELGIPSTMSVFGVAEADLNYMVESAYGNRRLMDNTPMDLSKEDIRRIYMEVL